ncbi:MAG: MBL fold metallo-hydrolase [Alkalilacustris sp.]
MADGSPRIAHPFADPPEPGAAVAVAEGVWWLRLPLPMRLDHVNAYALADDDGWTLVDTGFDTPAARAAWDKALSGPLRGRPVARVLVTHHHPDHVGLAGWFQTVHGAELWMPRTGWLFARMLTLDIQARPTPQTLAFWRAAGLDSDDLARRAQERPFNFADVVHPMPAGFRRLEDGRVVRMGGRCWDVRFGDGHAPDHATLWSREDGLVLGGDQLLPGISPNLGVYPTEPEADPVAEWLASCERLASFAREDQLVLPGHKLPFTGLPLRLAQLIDNHHGALSRLRAHLVEPHTAVGCFPALFKRPIGAGELTLALVEAVAHLNHLERLGQARWRQDTDGVRLWQAC